MLSSTVRYFRPNSFRIVIKLSRRLLLIKENVVETKEQFPNSIFVPICGLPNDVSQNLESVKLMSSNTQLRINIIDCIEAALKVKPVSFVLSKVLFLNVDLWKLQ